MALPVPGGGTAVQFSAPHMAAFEIHIPGRENAENDYTPDVCAAGEKWFSSSTQEDRSTLLASIMAGLPGAYTRYSIDGLQKALGEYQRYQSGGTARQFRPLSLAEIIPTADELGMRMCVHPDDPPRDILGLPRVVSNEEDIAWILAQQDSLANGLTLCSGSLGANPSKRLACNCAPVR